MALLDADLRHVAAPMVNQSDLPFRALVRNHGATLAYTQMLDPARLDADADYLAFHRRDLSSSPHPVVVQVCGNDSTTIVRGCRKLADLCDGIDLNLGCPQEHARAGHYGAYLLGKKDWPLIQDIVSALTNSVPVPISAKLRLCSPTESTVDLAQKISLSGARFIALHARHASAKRRRQGAANLDVVKNLVRGVDVPIMSNGNVRTWDDIQKNLEFTGAKGAMVGETLLGNPYRRSIFENKVADPIDVSLEYLDLCDTYPETASMKTIRAHVRHFVEFQCERRPWYQLLRSELDQSGSVESMRALLDGRARQWWHEGYNATEDTATREDLNADTNFHDLFR